MAVHSPNFRKGLASIVRGDRLIAPLRAYLMNPDFVAFDVRVAGLEPRQPDYYFHPSTHPGWSARALYLWMTEPHRLIADMDEPTAILSMTAGSIWHSIIQYCLVEMGLIHSPEFPMHDEHHRTRGKGDGIMTGDDEIFEFKTAKEQVLRKITSVEEYLRLKPGYHMQANEYMRMSGIHRERVLLMSLTFPYEMREFVIEYDHVLGAQQVAKYELVLQAVADQRIPMCDGCLRIGNCPARSVCADLNAIPTMKEPGT